MPHYAESNQVYWSDLELSSAASPGYSRYYSQGAHMTSPGAAFHSIVRAYRVVHDFDISSLFGTLLRCWGKFKTKVAFILDVNLTKAGFISFPKGLIVSHTCH